MSTHHPLTYCEPPGGSAVVPERFSGEDKRCCDRRKRLETLEKDGAQGRNRTTDTVIFRRGFNEHHHTLAVPRCV